MSIFFVIFFIEVIIIFQLKWVWSCLKGKRGFFITAIVISILTSGATFIIPQLTQILVDDVIVGTKDTLGNVIHHTEKLVPLLLGMILVQVVFQSLRYIMVLFLENSSQYMLMGIKEKLFSNLQHLDLGYYSEHRTGDLMTRLTGDLDYVRHTVAWISYVFVDCIVLFTTAMVFYFIQSTELALMILTVTPIILFITILFSKKINPVYTALREKLSSLNTCAQENIEGNRVVKAFNRQKFEETKFEEKNNEFRDMNLKAVYTWQKFLPALDFVSQSMTIITVLGGGFLIMNGKLTFGQLSIFLMFNWAIAGPMHNIGILLNDIQRFFPSASKIIELYYAKPVIFDPEHTIDVKKPLKGKITFSNVSLKFDSKTVFENISFELNPGETLGIIGPTGSGKTSIVNLIGRFYDVSDGEVKFDGVNVKSYKLTDLRSAIGMATQDVFLFSDTVDGNIAYSDPEMSEEDVLKYAKVADCDFVNDMSEGFDTIVGERGVGLSGGQRQRLALARALAKKPALLILDDTTSAVDMETEKLIQKNLSELDTKCTKIIIAQRISSIKNADKIIVLRNQKIEEMGTHEELIKKGGYYSRINTLQNNGFDLKKGGDESAEK